jgi:PTH2 family peptidyl-tRNA hydrolase
MRQLIIARKDLQMSPGKLAAQCCHASIAFITSQLRDKNNITECMLGPDENPTLLGYDAELYFDKEVYEGWICGIFTKTICEAKNRNQLMKAVTIANELGLTEGEDYFLIKDCCLTELTPEEVDENGVGRVLTCIGFKPLPDDIAHKISKKFQLYK